MKQFVAPGPFVRRPKTSDSQPPDPGNHDILDENDIPILDENNNAIQDEGA